MSDFTTFSMRVQDVMRDEYRTPHWTPHEAHRYMVEYGTRRKRFVELSRHLNSTVVRPRLKLVSSFFANANVKGKDLPNRSTCWFDFCNRFPAIVSLEFTIEHDVRFEKAIVGTQTYMMPVFVRFTEQDRLSFPLDSVDESQVADWVEERLLEFLDTYLRIDSGDEDAEEDLAMDPICGMRLRRSDAAATDSYYGHPYYFCSEDCRQQFQQDPEQYVQIKTM